MKTAPRYAHTQKGVPQPILLALAAICFGIAFFMRDISPYMIIFVAAAIACIVLSFTHGRLSVRDEGDCLSVRFGPIPLFKKSIPYAEITNVKRPIPFPLRLGYPFDQERMALEYRRIRLCAD